MPSPPTLLSPDPIIRLVNLRKRFGSRVVLDGMNLDIQPAKTTVVLGPSGCGKSVMLKHIVGLLRPDDGEIYYDGKRIDHLKERDLKQVRLEIGLLFQMAALFDSMNVFENVAFPLHEHTDLDEKMVKNRVALALATVDLSGTERLLPSELSGGQKKRVALARAIVLQPRVVLFDEPTTGLDPVRADGIDQLIIKLRKEFGVTNLVVTHDLTSARKIADHCVMLLNGRVLAQGTFDELASCPDPKVQHFFRAQYDHDDDSPDARARATTTPPISEIVR